MATVTGSKRHLDIASDTLTTSSNVDVGAKLFITTTDSNTTSTTALVLNGDEVEARTLGSNAFNSTAFLTSETFSSSDVVMSLSGDDIIAGTSITLAGGLSYTDSTNTLTSADTTYSAGTLLDLSGTTFSVDLTELTNNTSTFAPTQDHFVILDNGVQAKKLGSSIFGSAAYEASTAFAAASHNHDSSYPAKSDSYISLFSNQWQATPEAKYVTIALPYMSGSGSSGYYIFDVFGYRDIGSMDSLVNYRVYAHVRSNGTEENDVKFHVYTLHEAASEEFEFAYKVNAGSTTSVYIFIEEDYSGLEIFGIPVTEGSLNLTTSGMISISETAPTGTTEIVRQVAHPKVDSVAGTYGNTANGTKIDTITIDENGHVTNVATGATGNMTGFFVEDGDGTEVQINNANEWKFVEGTGIDINWTDTNTGNDSDPYDLTFAIKNNSIGIDQLNVTDGTNGQVLTTNGSGTLSFSTVTSGTSYGWTLGGTDIESGDEIALGGGLSLSGTSGSYTLTSANDNTTYSAGSGLSLSSTTFSVDEFIEDKHIYTKNENGTANKGIFMPMVKGGFYATSTSTITGRLKVVLPSFKTNMMVSFKLDIYEYNTDRTVSYQISGYNNNDSNATWYNTSVVCLSDSDNRNLTVRFLRDLDAQEQYIGIGETTTTWSYPQVIVRDFMGGYNTQISKANGSWSVDFIEDDPGVVVNTHSNNTPIVLTSRLSGTISTAQLADNSVNATKLNVSGNGTSGQVLTSDGDGTFSWTAKTTNTNTVTSVGVSGSETTGTVTIAASGAASVSQSGSTITIDATNTNTTYSAGSGLDLTGTSFSVEADLRDGITHVGKDTSNYITFDSTNGRIDFYAGGVFVARMESDGDLHIKGDVIAFSDIFS